MGRTVDTLSMFDELKKTFSEEQAHSLSEILKNIEEENLEVVATKRDLHEQEMRLKHDLTLRLGAMLAATAAIIVTLVKLMSS